MKSIVIRSTYQQIKAWPADFRVLASFILGIGICIYNASRFCYYSSFVGQKVQMYEAFIIIGSTGTHFMGLILGNLLLVSDAPFVSQLSKYEIAMVGRKTWLKARILYLLNASLIYLIVIICCTIAFSAIVCGIRADNHWSESIILLAEKQPQFATSTFGIIFPYPEYINCTTPYFALFLTLLFNWAYIVFIGLCVLCVNLLSSRNIGWFVAASIHIVGYIIYANGGFFAPARYSPLCWALPGNYYVQSNRMSLFVIFCLFAFLIITQIDICKYAVEKYEL